MKKSLLCLFIILLLCLYTIFIVEPYGTAYIYVSECASPQESAIPGYILRVVPMLVSYCIFYFINIKQFKYIRFLVHPLSFIIIIWGIFLSIMGYYGGVAIWYLVFTYIPLCLILLSIFLYSIMLDYEDIKKYINEHPDKYNFYKNLIVKNINIIAICIILLITLFIINS